MLRELFQWLSQDIHSFAVFNYLTLRAVLAAATSLMIGLFSGPYVIRKLTALKIGQAVRNDGPQSHLTKSGTPTMGGALILLSIAITTLLWGDLGNRFLWVVLLVTLAFGAGGRHFDSIEALIGAAQALLRAAPQASVLVKGSRFMRLERVVAALAPAAPDAEPGTQAHA